MFLSATATWRETASRSVRAKRAGRRRRRLRGQHRMDEAILGRPAADNFLIRGTPYNRGTVLQAAARQGRGDVGDPTQCHAVAIDARAPKFDGGIITRLDCVVFGIVVNKHAQRFYDEGEDSGRNATRSGAAWSPASPTRSPTSSSTRPRSTCSCRRCSRRSRRRRSRELARQARARSADARDDGRRFQRGRAARHLRSHRARRLPHRGARRRRRRHWARPHRDARRSTPIRCVPASPSLISEPA